MRAAFLLIIHFKRQYFTFKDARELTRSIKVAIVKNFKNVQISPKQLKVGIGNLSTSYHKIF